MDFFSKTDIGLVRETNQDSCFAGYLGISDDESEDAFLAIVCDGMGGANGGSTASGFAVRDFFSTVKERLLRVTDIKDFERAIVRVLEDAVNEANRHVFELSKNEPTLRGMGTTLVALLIYRSGAYVTNVGDSRLYVKAGEEFHQLTHDHSYVQTLVDSGKITKTEAETHPQKNIIMRAVGTEETVCADYFKILPYHKTFLLCSDGLSGYVDEDTINTLLGNGHNPQNSVEKLIKTANRNGGGDNVTAVVVHFD